MLTELEATVLGEISIQQPCTAYAVRQAYAQSPTPTWSGSAGTIYPVIQRLMRRRLVRGTPASRGRRRSMLLSLTPAGRRRLHAWLLEPLNAQVTGPPMDPLRVRIGFLGALTPAQQRDFLRRAFEGVRLELRHAEQYHASDLGSRGWEWLASWAVIGAQRARLTFVRQALDLATGKRGLPGGRQAPRRRLRKAR